MERVGEEADLIVVSDDAGDLQRLAADRELFDDDVRAAIARRRSGAGRASRNSGRGWGLSNRAQGIERLYTPAMLAELVRRADRGDSPLAAARRAGGEARSAAAAVFRFRGSARRAEAGRSCWQAGCSLATVNRRLDELARLLPELPRPLADPAVVVEGRRLFVRRGDSACRAERAAADRL